MSEDGQVVVQYEPRKQFLPFHLRKTRFACLVAHRRAGKTVACVNELVARAIYSKKKRPRYAYIGPLLKQAKKIAWEYLKEYTNGLESKKPSESELTVRLRHNDAEISIYGADNPDAFRGQYFDGVVLDEYGDMSPSVWSKVLLPTLADRRGWAVFIGTFKGRNHFYKIWRQAQGFDLPEDMNSSDFTKDWYHYTLKASESNILPASELSLQKMQMDEEEYQQEYECNPNAVVKGTYYSKIIAKLEGNGQIYADVEWDPDQPVDVAADLGFTDSSAYWFFQKRPDGLAIINYLEAHSKPLEYYFGELSDFGYRYGTIWLPHDARAKSLQTGRSTIEQFLAARFPVRIAPNMGIQDGIEAVRLILPKCFFSPRTEYGVEALRAYKRGWDEDRKVFSDSPYHDWSSHGSDAFRYLALVAKEIRTDTSDTGRSVVPSPKLQLEVLFQERERRYKNLRNRI